VKSSSEVLDLDDPSAACTWELPGDATGAKRARRLLVATLTGFGALPEIIGDAELMVSELATNAFRHAPDNGPHELWLDLTGPWSFMCAVFDTLPVTALSSDPTAAGDFGRGLSIVAEFSKGRWGARGTRSRLRPAVSGKAIWFAGDLPYRPVDATATAVAARLLTTC
jgi:histidine kinase-like protein